MFASENEYSYVIEINIHIIFEFTSLDSVLPINIIKPLTSDQLLFFSTL